MTIQKVIKKLTSICLVVLFLISLFAAYIFYAWNYQKHLVDELGRNLTRHYVHYYKYKYEKAEKLYKKNKAEGADAFEDLKEDFQDIKMRDRLFGVKTNIYNTLIQYYTDQGKHKKAFSLLREIADEMPRNLNFRFKKIQYQFRYIDKEKSLAEMGVLWNRFPEVYKFSEAYSRMLLEQNDIQTLKDVVGQFHFYLTEKLRLPEGLSIYWGEKGFSGKNRKVVKLAYPEKNQMETIFTLPKNTRLMRVDFGSFVALDRPVAIITAGKRKEKIRLWEQKLNFKEMKQDGSSLIVLKTRDPYFSLWLPKKLYGPKLTVQLKGQIRIIYPEWLDEIKRKLKDHEEINSK